MAIVFLYRSNFQFWISAIFSDITLIIAYLMVIKSSNQQLENSKRIKLLKIFALANILLIIFIRLMPNAVLHEFTPFAFQVFKFYHLIKNLILLITMFLTFGMCMLIFGIYNKHKYLIFGGLFMVFTFFMNFVNTLLYFGPIINNSNLPQKISAFQNVIWIIYFIISNLSITTFILGIALIIVHCQINSDKILLYGILMIILQQVGSGFLHQIISIFT